MEMNSPSPKSPWMPTLIHRTIAKKPSSEDPRAALKWNENSCRGLLQLLGVEDGPVVDVVQINGTRVAGAVVGEAGGGEDALAGLIVVDVATDVGVVTVDVGLGELHTRIGGDPGFALGIGWLLVLDEGVEVVPLDAEIVGGEFVITAADGVVGVDFAGGVKGGLQPDAGEVKNTEGTGDAGGDHGNDLAHKDWGWWVQKAPSGEVCPCWAAISPGWEPLHCGDAVADGQDFSTKDREFQGWGCEISLGT